MPGNACGDRRPQGRCTWMYKCRMRARLQGEGETGNRSRIWPGPCRRQVNKSRRLGRRRSSYRGTRSDRGRRAYRDVFTACHDRRYPAWDLSHSMRQGQYFSEQQSFLRFQADLPATTIMNPRCPIHAPAGPPAGAGNRLPSAPPCPRHAGRPRRAASPCRLRTGALVPR